MRSPSSAAPPLAITFALAAAILVPILGRVALSAAAETRAVRGRYRLDESAVDSGAPSSRSEAHRSLDLRGPAVRGADRPPARAVSGTLETCLRVDTAGLYSFLVSSDRPSSFFVDEREITRAVGARGLRVGGGSTRLRAGIHPIRVELEGPWETVPRVSVWMAKEAEIIHPIPPRSLTPPARCRPPAAMPPSVPR